MLPQQNEDSKQNYQEPFSLFDPILNYNATVNEVETQVASNIELENSRRSINTIFICMEPNSITLLLLLFSVFSFSNRLIFVKMVLRLQN